MDQAHSERLQGLRLHLVSTRQEPFPAVPQLRQPQHRIRRHRLRFTHHYRPGHRLGAVQVLRQLEDEFVFNAFFDTLDAGSYTARVFYATTDLLNYSATDSRAYRAGCDYATAFALAAAITALRLCRRRAARGVASLPTTRRCGLPLQHRIPRPSQAIPAGASRLLPRSIVASHARRRDSEGANSEMTEAPNHALQRTAPRVTLAAAAHPATFAHPAPAALPQPARRAPQSLSLGSLGDFAHLFLRTTPTEAFLTSMPSTKLHGLKTSSSRVYRDFRALAFGSFESIEQPAFAELAIRESATSSTASLLGVHHEADTSRRSTRSSSERRDRATVFSFLLLDAPVSSSFPDIFTRASIASPGVIPGTLFRTSVLNNRRLTMRCSELLRASRWLLHTIPPPSPILPPPPFRSQRAALRSR